jgi:hypothetical protein
MDERFSTKNLLVLRKLTRAIADLLRNQVREYLTTLGILLRPAGVLGEFVEGNKEFVKGADQAFKEVVSLYEAVAVGKPFNLPKELQPPLEVISSALEITPLEYTHAAKMNGDTKTVTVTSPLKWVLTYSGFAPKRLRDLLATRAPDKEVQHFVLHTLMLHVVLGRAAGMKKILEALHFPVTTGRLPGFGELPITFVASEVTTLLPPDAVIIESTEIAGMDAFEEVVNIDDIVQLSDPLKQRLLELVQSQSEDLLPR